MNLFPLDSFQEVFCLPVELIEGQDKMEPLFDLLQRAIGRP